MPGVRFFQGGKPITIRQPEIKQHKGEIRMFFQQSHGLAPTRRLQDRRAPIELLQDAAQSLPNQSMIVDQEKFHLERCLARQYFGTRTKVSRSYLIARSQSKTARTYRNINHPGIALDFPAAISWACRQYPSNGANIRNAIAARSIRGRAGRDRRRRPNSRLNGGVRFDCSRLSMGAGAHGRQLVEAYRRSPGRSGNPTFPGPKYRASKST